MFIQTVLASVVRLVLAAAFASSGDEIPNWPSPATWTPARSVSTQAARAVSDPLPFFAVTPCRGADTRGNGFTGEYGPPSFGGDSTRTFTIVGTCGVPASAAAVSLNFTVTNNPTFGDIRVFPAGGSVLVSTLNWGGATGNVANAAVVALSAGGAISVQVDGPGPIDLIYDINGYYAAAPVTSVVQRRRAVLDQFWTPQNAANLGLTTLGDTPALVKFDGADLWVATGSSVARVRASDGKFLDAWSGATGASGVLAAMGKIFVTGSSAPGRLYRIDPNLSAGAVTTVASNLGSFPYGITFDGSRIWTANGQGNATGSVSMITPGATIPFIVATVTSGLSAPVGILYDGANVWVSDRSVGLVKMNANGIVLQTVVIGTRPGVPVFDGANIWVPNNTSSSVSVVRASTGSVLATLTGNGLDRPAAAAFDGQRILVTNSGNDSVSLWRAADQAPLGSSPIGAGTSPLGATSDGVNFWITLANAFQLARF